MPSPTTTSTQTTNNANNDPGKSKAYDAPTMNLPLFLLWILPLCSIALYSRVFADLTPITIPVDPHTHGNNKKKKPRSSPTMVPSSSSSEISFPASWPTAYTKTVKTIHKRRRRIPGFPGDIDNLIRTNKQIGKEETKPKKPKAAPKADALDDPAKAQVQQQIARLLQDFQEDNDIYQGIAAADAMRYYTMQYHEGGTYESEAIALYDRLIDMGQTLRNATVTKGRPTRKSTSVNEEVILDYKDKSPDGLLCGLYTAQGKTLFLANLFERAVEAYNGCIFIDEDYLDALNARGSALIVLGRYKDAGQDLLKVIHKDHNRFFVDAFSGLSRVLEAKEDVVQDGWQALIEPTEELLPLLEYKHEKDEAHRNAASLSLARLHHVLFTYHEKKTKQYKTAFDHLEQAHQYKLSTLPPWNGDMEKLKVKQLQHIFQKGFWSSMKTGSSTNVPIFIIGFVRSGSTLLERILDAHPDIVGTGEDSVFNGRLGEIRNAIVEASNMGGGDMASVTESLADSVVDEMYRRWSIIDASSNDIPSTTKPKRLADKMLTNYYNVGFIEMLYPNALILHVAREPMDSIFSAFKHDFPSGTLDYTSDMNGVTDLYTAYRDVMDHWDDVLPGRIMHVRYEDMVNDFERTARAIVNATGLPWNDDVLEFHKQKHAVNTFSSTQVRKGVYKSGMKFWMRYETELAPLTKKVGERVKYDLRTTLPGYSPPVKEEEESGEPTSNRRFDEL